jgi:hypothetical protein
MKKYILLLLLQISTVFLYGQKWGVQTHSNFSNEALDVEVDNTGNTYIAGYVTGETEFSISTQVASAPGNGDVYVAKYSPDGNLLWMKQFGGNFMDRAYDLAIGPDQNVVVTGIFTGSVAFGTTTLQSAQGSKDVFLLKLGQSGNVIWARKEGGNLSENSYGVTVDHQNNVILTGQFEGSTSIANQNFTSLIDPFTNLPSFDLFISKYDSNGNPLWVKVGLAEKEDRGLAVAVDAQDNIFLSGQYSDTLQFAGTTINNNGLNVGFVTKLSPSGQVQFFNNLRAGSCIPYDLEVNGNNQVVIIGDFSGNLSYYNNSLPTVITNAYSKRIFVLQIQNNGQYQWSYTLGSDNELSARALTIDSNNDVYVVGYFKCALTQLHEPVPSLWNAVGFRDTYLLKVNNTGVFKYAKQMGGHFNDNIHGIAIKTIENPIICGSFIYDYCVMQNPQPYSVTQFTEYNHYLTSYNSGGMLANGFHSPSVNNSFLLKAVNNNTLPLNFFKQVTNDSLESYIYGSWSFGQLFPSESDTVEFCDGNGSLYVYIPTFEYDGPRYTYLWSNGDTDTIATTINQSGYYSVTISRFDGCASTTDSVYAIFNPIPPLPLMNDNLGLAVNEPGSFYWHYRFCSPDSVELSFSNLCAGCSISVGNYTQYYSDTLAHFYPDIGIDTNYSVTISKDNCFNSGYFIIGFDHHFVVDSIQLGITSTNAPNYGDTLYTCDAVFVYGFDSLSVLNGYRPAIDEPYLNYSWTVNGIYNSNQDTIGTLFGPPSTGWYTFELDLSLGKVNMCDTVIQHYHALDSFYIVLLTSGTFIPVISDVSNSVLCANTTGTLTVSPTNPNYSWSGPGIIWTSTDGDSIQINQAGIYSYYGTITDSITGCLFSSSDYVIIGSPLPPNLADYTNADIVCPNSSTQFTLPSNYQSYTWYGPNGNVISTTNTCTASIAGFYYCNLVDANFCNITTSPFELTQYQTPSIVVNPQNYICNNENVTIEVVYTGNPTIVWSPDYGNQSQITVNQPGTYSVAVTQCGITTTFEEIILDGSFFPTISSTSTQLCYNDQILISGNIPNANYEWTNGQTSGQYFVVTEPGIYTATVTNQFGCEVETNSIEITAVSGSVPPEIESVNICSIDTVTFTDVTNFALNWYDLDTNLLISSNSLILPNVDSDTSFLVAYSNSICPLVYTNVSINVVEEISDFSLVANTHLCENESTLIMLQHDPTITFKWFNGDTVSLQVSVETPGVYSVTLYQCGLETLENITIFDASFEASISASDTIFCQDNEFTNGSNAIQLKVTPSNANVLWSTGNNLDNSLKISSPGTYYATLTNQYGCKSVTDTVDIFGVICNDELPNVITVNADGNNDLFIIDEALLLHNNRLLIINRWGNVILDERGYRNTFDGLNCTDGVYFYFFYPDYDLDPKRVKRGFLHIIH